LAPQPLQDRDPYLFDDPVTGLPGSTTKAHDEIAHNYILANGNTLGPVDNDDGSSYYNTHDNFFVWGAGGMKTDFEGTDSIWDSNVVALSWNPAIHNGYDGTIGTPGNAPYCLDGHEHRFTRNQVYYFGDDWTYAMPICNGTGATIIGNNLLWTYSGNASRVNECGASLPEWQARGYDLGTTVSALTADVVGNIIAQARAALWV
jgi:hypothetical protein